MRSGRRLRIRSAAAAGVVALVAAATIRSVHADDLVPVQLELEGPTGCPDGAAFTREVLARAPRARIAAPAERARALLARVKPGGPHGYDGVLVVRDNGGAATERAVHAPSCDELVTALAVIAAVVIDPMTAKTGAIDASAPADAAADVSEVLATDAAPPTTATTPDASTEWPTEPPPNAEPRDAWEMSVGGGGGAVGGSAPTLMFSVPVFFEVFRNADGIVAPAIRLRFERTATAPSEIGAFARTGGALDVCPIAFRARSLRAQPCGRLELAALFASGREVDPIRSDLRPWFALGPVARVRLELATPLFLELEGALLLAIVRDRFFVEPGTLVYRAPLVGATTAFAVGLVF
ncbi:MAG: hypothetical protein JWO86_7928 [Myxococcaceae bacterium]|nr:hypothetical protein [Myxococcaceae bacterium]